MNNRHLNIFEHYTQKESLPIENNLTRGLAILLNENNLVLDRFIDLLNLKISSNKSDSIIPKPQNLEERDIGIQQQITKILDNYPNPRYIIGITLTTKYPIEIIENEYDINNNLITDIIINCKDTLIVIEAKRNSSDARLQLNQQIDSIVSGITDSDTETTVKELLDITWEELISILQDVHSLEKNNNQSLLGHYLNHLEFNYPEWFPVSLLTEMEFEPENEARIDKRILKIIQNCCNNKEDMNKYSGRAMIPIDCTFTNEAQISMNYDKKSLMVKLWAGDTKRQGSFLLNNTDNNFSWVYNDTLLVDGVELRLITKPYLRVAHFNKSIIIEYFNIKYYKNNFDSSKSKCLELYSDITKRWKKSEWNQLKQILTSKYNGLINNDSFDNSFNEKFEESNRTYADVAFGYSSTIYIPIEIINKYEKSAEKNNDQLAAFISNTISEHISHIK